MTATLTGVLDLEETATIEKSAHAEQLSSTLVPDESSQFAEETPRANGTMIVAMICVAAFSVCLVAFVLYPVLQTLLGAATSSWNPAP